jgi:TFIIF-interacting CTD phosphatase-like protein
MVEEIAAALDPNMSTFNGILGRECTIVRNGRYIKDFSYLGRPIKEVVYIDFTAESAPYHKDNVIILPEFEGDIDDRHLYEIIPFLKRK